MRILIKISGEGLVAASPSGSFNLCTKKIQDLVNQIKKLQKNGHEICVVLGGGNIFRGVDGLPGVSVSRETCDHMGMMATIFNGLIFSSFFEKATVFSGLDVPGVVEKYTSPKARKVLEQGGIPFFVGGIGLPYFSTDMAAVLRATEMSCDLLIKGTKVAGVYDKDPLQHANAKHYPTLTYDEALKQELRFMDSPALALAKENNLSLAVASIYHTDSLIHVVNKEGKFTQVENHV